MKLRNKKTGEIGYTGLAVDGLLPVAIEGRVAGKAEQRYRTLAELNAEWEDYEEEWGFAPDSDYEVRKCNKSDEELAKIAKGYCEYEEFRTSVMEGKE